MMSRSITGLFCVGTWLAGCHASPDRDGPPPRTHELSEEVDIEPAVSDSLRLSLDLPRTVRAGEPVPINLHVENTTDRTLDLYLRGRTIAFDLVVADEAGEVVWRRLEGEIIPAILRIEPLPAGNALSLEAVWDQQTNAGGPVEPGIYTVHGELLTESDPLISPTERVRIEPN